MGEQISQDVVSGYKGRAKEDAYDSGLRDKVHGGPRQL